MKKPVPKKDKNHFLFNVIAPVYGLFHSYQQKKFSQVIENMRAELDLSTFQSVLDVGCGTGALCSVLLQEGLEVTGVDPAKKMIALAQRKSKGAHFFQADALSGLPYKDDSFDIVFASYVAHGLKAKQRKLLYQEMGRLARFAVIIYDYNHNRSLLTTVVEWLEGGDYFHFIRHAETEMKECMVDTHALFSSVKVVQVDVRASWYICTPKKN